MDVITSKGIASMSDQSAYDDLAADLLRGADEISEFLTSIGFKNATPGKVYYWVKNKRIPVSKFGNELIASKSKIVRDTRKLITQLKSARTLWPPGVRDSIGAVSSQRTAGPVGRPQGLPTGESPKGALPGPRKAEEDECIASKGDRSQQERCDQRPLPPLLQPIGI
jgi:hypothetical protein